MIMTAQLTIRETLEIIATDLDSYQDFLINTRIREAVDAMYAQIKGYELSSSTPESAQVKVKCHIGHGPGGYIFEKYTQQPMHMVAELQSKDELISHFNNSNFPFTLSVKDDTEKTSFNWIGNDKKTFDFDLKESSWEYSCNTSSTIKYFYNMAKIDANMAKSFTKLQRNLWRYQQAKQYRQQITDYLSAESSQTDQKLEGLKQNGIDLAKNVLKHDTSTIAARLLANVVLFFRGLCATIGSKLSGTKTPKSALLATKVNAKGTMVCFAGFFNSPRGGQIKRSQSDPSLDSLITSDSKSSSLKPRSKSSEDVLPSRQLGLFSFAQHRGIAKSLSSFRVPFKAATA
jgi:hypothetical protein